MVNEIKCTFTSGKKSFGVSVDARDFELSSIQKLVEFFCSQATGFEYLGERVDQARQCHILVKHKDKVYRVGYWLVPCAEGYSVNLFEYKENLENTEAKSTYKYYVDYCRPSVDRRRCHYWFYKESEVEEAEKKVQELGEGFAYLKEL